MSHWKIHRKRSADIRFPYARSFFAISMGVISLVVVAVALMDPLTGIISAPGPVALAVIILIWSIGFSVVYTEIRGRRKR